MLNTSYICFCYKPFKKAHFQVGVPSIICDLVLDTHGEFRSQVGIQWKPCMQYMMYVWWVMLWCMWSIWCIKCIWWRHHVLGHLSDIINMMYDMYIKETCIMSLVHIPWVWPPLRNSDLFHYFHFQVRGFRLNLHVPLAFWEGGHTQKYSHITAGQPTPPTYFFAEIKVLFFFFRPYLREAKWKITALYSQGRLFEGRLGGDIGWLVVNHPLKLGNRHLWRWSFRDLHGLVEIQCQWMPTPRILHLTWLVLAIRIWFESPSTWGLGLFMGSYPPAFSRKQRVKKALEGLDCWNHYDPFPLFIGLLSGVNQTVSFRECMVGRWHFHWFRFTWTC